MNNENFNKKLREALRQSAMESTPAAGWEQRVLDETFATPRRHRHIWRYVSAAAVSAAAAAVIILITLAKPAPQASTTTLEPANSDLALIIAQAPAPVERPAVETPEVTPRQAVKQPQQPVVILPEPLPESDSEYAIDYSIGAEYIDELLAQCLAEEDEILATILDPDFNASFIPLQ